MNTKIAGALCTLLLEVPLLLCGQDLLPRPAASSPDPPLASAAPASHTVLQKWVPSCAVFVENRGQWEDPSVRYALHGRRMNVALTTEGMRFQLTASSATDGGRVHFGNPPVHLAEAALPRAKDASQLSSVPKRIDFSIRFVGGRDVQPVGRSRSSQVFHYHVGGPDRWRENVVGWQEVDYREIYPGIDLRVRGNATGLKYEFHLCPGADWRTIKWCYEGIERLRLKPDGSLSIHLEHNLPPLVDGAPLIYQETQGRRIEVSGRFVLLDERTCGFAVTGEYDPALPLVIDPVIEWGAYVHDAVVGGHSARAVAVDPFGNVLITGEGNSFVVKLDPTGNLLWSTRLADYSTTGNDIAVDAQGNVLIAGYTTAAGWTSGGHQTNYQGNGDGFLVKLNAAGQHLWSTYIGGTNFDLALGLAVDDQNQVVVVGQSTSSYWVSTGTRTVDGGSDGFVALYETNGALLRSAYLAQSGADSWVNTASAYDVECKDFYYYICGWAEFCQVIHLPPQVHCTTMPYVMRLSMVGSEPDWTVATSVGLRLEVDDFGAVLVCGTIAGGPSWSSIANVTKLTSTGAQQWSLNVGGASPDEGTDLATDSAGNVFLTGWTESTNWVSGGFDTNHHGRRDAFIAKISPGGSNLWSAYLGGTNDDYGNAIALDAADNIYVAGETWSAGWLTGSYDSSLYSIDAFVVKLRPAARLKVMIEPAPAVTLGAGWRRVGTVGWLEAGATEPSVAPGPYTIEFKDVPDWLTPPPLRVTLADNQDLTLNVTYQPQRAGLSWASYLGGNYSDFGEDVATDAAGNLVVVGRTRSSGWVSGGYDPDLNGSEDAFVLKRSAEGTPLWSTFLGGDGTDQGLSIAVDDGGNILVAGLTTSGYWCQGGYDTTYDGGNGDGFVAKLSPNGAFLWSSYLGGSKSDYGYAVAVDLSNHVLVSGVTESSNWVSGLFDTSHNGGGDAFVVKLNPNGAHVWSTYLGGTNWERGYGVAADSMGNVLVTGETSSPGWGVGGFDTTLSGASDGFVIKLNPAGSHLWTTYLGGADSDNGKDIALDAADNIFVTGWTFSTNWISGGFDVSHNGSADAYVFKLSPGGMPVWSTYLGGSNLDIGNRLAIDEGGNVLITGNTSSTGWVANGMDLVCQGGGDAFVAKVSSVGEHLWSTCLGGTNNDSGNGIALGLDAEVFVVGTTYSTNWISPGLDPTFNGGDCDAFVVAIAQLPVPLIRIQKIERLTDSSFRLTFSVAADPAPALQVQRTTSLVAPVSWVLEPGAVIVPLAPGLLQADVPQSGSQCFYRLRKL